MNQFHDILPGTCIPRAHDEAISAVGHIIEEAGRMSRSLLEAKAQTSGETSDAGRTVTLVNTLSFPREDVVYLPFQGFYVKGDYPQQVVEDMDGVRKLAVQGVVIPAFGSAVLELTQEHGQEQSPFTAQGSVLETPLARVEFNEKGYMESFVDRRNGRQLRGPGSTRCLWLRKCPWDGTTGMWTQITSANSVTAPVCSPPRWWRTGRWSTGSGTATV